LGAALARNLFAEAEPRRMAASLITTRSLREFIATTG
jgi:hypothetical protein